MEFANISIKGWIICSYVQGFLDGSQKAMIFSPQDGKVVNSDIVTRDVNKVM